MKGIRVLVCAVALGLASCGEDAPVGDPGGMGAGRPDTAGSVEDPAVNILTEADHPTQQDTTAAGAPGMTGTLRDSLNDGEATGAGMPQPDRPAN